MFHRVAFWWRSLAGGSTPSPAPHRCEKCGRPARVFEYFAGREGASPDRHYCPPCAEHALWIPNATPRDAVDPMADGSAEVPVEVERIIFFSDVHPQVIVLRELDGPRAIALITGYCEATALWRSLKGEPSPWPMTHQVWANSIMALGAEARSACVLTCNEGIYFAEVRLLQGGTPVKIDVRPTDGLLLAMRAGVPFLFKEGLLRAYADTEPEPA